MQYSDYPCLFQKSDTASVRQQNSYLTASKVEFVFVVLAALVGGFIFSGNPRICTFCAVLTAATLFFAFIARIIVQLTHWDKKWFDTRAIAESVKTATWRFIMAVDPYHKAVQDIETDKKFVDDLTEIFKARPEAHATIATCLSKGDQQISSRMKEIRNLPIDDRKSIYLQQRINDQKDWYKKKAKFNADRDGLWFFVIMGCEVVGIIIAVIIVSFPSIILNPIGLVTTLTAVFCAWAQIKKHRELAQSYALAEQELASIASLASNVKTENELMEYVVNTENAISREHTMWCAKRI